MPLPTERQFTIPLVERGTPKEQVRHAVIMGGISEARSIIIKQFENLAPGATLEDRLTYHTHSHTEGALWRGLEIVHAMQKAAPELITEREIELVLYAIAWHDSIQEYKPEDQKVLPGDDRKGRKRVRATGQNEEQSADLAEAYLRQAMERLGDSTLFSGHEIEVVRAAIMLTVPHFDKELGTVTQPTFATPFGDQEGFSASDYLVAQAVALADLGGLGMERFYTARWQADSLFLEENLDVANYVSRLTGEDTTKRRFLRNPEEERFYFDRMIDHLTRQIVFITARSHQTQVEIGQMDKRVQNALHNLFVFYQEAIAGTEAFLRGRKSMTFDEWVEDMSTVLDNPPAYANIAY